MQNHGKISIVGGVPGVGKTTVINHTLHYAKSEELEIIILVYGTIMMEIAKLEYNVQNRDELRNLPSETQKEIQRRAAIKIADRAKGKIAIVDTHYTIKTGTGSFLQGIPQWVSDELNPSLLVIIETDPDEIIQRRSTDETRFRDQETKNALIEHQLINKTVASTICQKTGALLAIIKNKTGNASEAGKELLYYLKSL